MPDFQISLSYVRTPLAGLDRSADHSDAPTLHVAGSRFRRFGRVAADGRVLSYTGLDRGCADDSRYLEHEIDTNAYGRPLPVSGQVLGLSGWGR